MKKRRTRSPHPGVVLLAPKPPRTTWRARYVDPDTERTTWERIDPVALRTADARRDWAIRKSRLLAKRRADLAAGAPRASGTALDDAVTTYFDDHPNLRESTRALYRQHINAFLDWAQREGIVTGDDLAKTSLVAFKASRVRLKRKSSAAGDRGAKKIGDATRAPGAINVELRSVRTVLGYLCELGLAARLSSDALRGGLKQLDAPSERVECLKTADLRRLLESALRHDSKKFTITRDEHAGLRAPNSTPRYSAIAPFVAGVLFSGMRLDEALSLDWKQVDLDAGEIALTTQTKTHKPREIDLTVSPGLRRLLAAMRLRNGGKGSVFALTRGEARAAERRLIRTFGAPDFSWQTLRQTCASYLTCAPAIFGSASAYHSARQLGHSVQVAEAHYVGRVRGISLDARDLESAMGVAEHVARIVASVGAPTGARLAL